AEDAFPPRAGRADPPARVVHRERRPSVERGALGAHVDPSFGRQRQTDGHVRPQRGAARSAGEPTAARDDPLPERLAGRAMKLAAALVAFAALAACQSTPARPPLPPHSPKVDVAGTQLPELHEPEATWLIEAVRAHAMAGEAGSQRWIARYPDRAGALIDAAPSGPPVGELARVVGTRGGPQWRAARTWVAKAEQTPALWSLAAIAAERCGDADLLWRALEARKGEPVLVKIRATFGESVLSLTLLRGAPELALRRGDALEA